MRPAGRTAAARCPTPAAADQHASLATQAERCGNPRVCLNSNRGRRPHRTAPARAPAGRRHSQAHPATPPPRQRLPTAYSRLPALPPLPASPYLRRRKPAEEECRKCWQHLEKSKPHELVRSILGAQTKRYAGRKMESRSRPDARAGAAPARVLRARTDAPCVCSRQARRDVRRPPPARPDHHQALRVRR